MSANIVTGLWAQWLQSRFESCPGEYCFTVFMPVGSTHCPNQFGYLGRFTRCDVARSCNWPLASF